MQSAEEARLKANVARLNARYTALRSQLATTTAPTKAAEIKPQLDAVEVQLREAEASLQSFYAQSVDARGQSSSFSIYPAEPRIFGMTQSESVFAFSLLIGFPLVMALAVRLVRRRPAAKPPLEDTRLARLEQAVEAVAIEVERIGESQRFQAKLMSERQPESVTGHR